MKAQSYLQTKLKLRRVCYILCFTFLSFIIAVEESWLWCERLHIKSIDESLRNHLIKYICTCYMEFFCILINYASSY